MCPSLAGGIDAVVALQRMTDQDVLYGTRITLVCNLQNSHQTCSAAPAFGHLHHQLSLQRPQASHGLGHFCTAIPNLLATHQRGLRKGCVDSVISKVPKTDLVQFDERFHECIMIGRVALPATGNAHRTCERRLPMR